MKQLAESIWVYETDFNFCGVEAGNRSAIIRLADQSLWIFSPSKADESVYKAIEALGTVQFLVAPNLMHHLFLDSYRERFPQAEVWMSDALAKKKKYSPSEYKSLNRETPPLGE